MSRGTMYLFINGILTKPADNFGWTDRACRWIEKNTMARADKYEYFCDAIFRRFFQQKRVKEIRRIIKEFNGFRIVLVGHSNGCDIITRLLKMSNVVVEEVHLIAAAAEPSFNTNGLNIALKKNRVEEVFIYGSQADHALKLAKNTGWFLRWFGLGYGDLGLVGPADVKDEFKNRVHVNFKHTYGHSTWFENEHFDKTMNMILRNH